MSAEYATVILIPVAYLIIVGGEWLLWPARFNVIRGEIRLNLVLLTIASLTIGGLLWLVDNVTLCWR